MPELASQLSQVEFSKEKNISEKDYEEIIKTHFASKIVAKESNSDDADETLIRPIPEENGPALAFWIWVVILQDVAVFWVGGIFVNASVFMFAWKWFWGPDDNDDDNSWFNINDTGNKELPLLSEQLINSIAITFAEN